MSAFDPKRTFLWSKYQVDAFTKPVALDVPLPVFIAALGSGSGVEGVHRLLQHKESIIAFLAGEIVELSVARARAKCLHVLFQVVRNARKLIASFAHDPEAICGR